MDVAVPTVAETARQDNDTQDPPVMASDGTVAGDRTGPGLTDTVVPRGPVCNSSAPDGSTIGDVVTTGLVVPGYEILGELGRGGMGVVYHARQVRLQRPCALKMILAGHHAGSAASARFLAEAATVAKLRHPNIVQIHAIGDHEGRSYIELEYIEGGSLARELDGTPWNPLRAAALVETLARATGEAHRLGIVHRDLKPGNVLLTSDGIPKLADFGLAKSIDSDSDLTKSGAIMGTPSYMAPEQAEGNAKGVGPAADLYALGAIVYELLTGRPPFRGATVFETLQQVKSAEPVPPSRLVPGLPRDIETIVLKCLQKDPGRRYESAAALADDLRRFRAGEPIMARPVGRIERTWRWCRRNPPLAGSLGAAIAALLAVAGLAGLYARGQARSRNEIAAVANDLKTSLATSNQRLAALYFERGQVAFEKGQTGQGLHWMIETWDSAVAANDPGWQHTARANLAAWQSHDIGLKAVFSHQGAVSAVAFSPDGKAVLTGSNDKTARLWNTAIGRPIGLPLTHNGAVGAVAFSPTGETVVTGSDDKTARLWNAVNGKLIGRPLEHTGAVRAVAFSPNGKAVLTGSDDKTARLWDAVTGEPIGLPMEHQHWITAVAFSPDGEAVLSGSDDKTARLWDSATGKPIGPPLVHQGAVRAVAFSPDGKTLLTCSSDDTARLWDSATGNPIGSPLAHKGSVRAAAFSPDGKTVLTASQDKTARFWDSATGKSIGPVLEHQHTVTAAAFSPDGKTVLTASEDKTARLWDSATGEPIGPAIAHQGGVVAAAFSPDGKTVLTASQDKTARLWNAENSTPVGPLLEHQHGITAVAFSPDGKAVLTASQDDTARLWNATTGKPIAAPMEHQGAVTAVAFSPDGKTMLTGSTDVTARLWDTATGKPIGPSLTHQKEVGAVAYSPDGKAVLTGSNDKTARLWDAATGKPIGPPMMHQSEVMAVAFSRDGKAVLTRTADNDAGLWDAATGKPIGLSEEMRGRQLVRAFSPDGRAVLIWTYAEIVVLWDAVGLTRMVPPMYDKGRVRVIIVAISPDGKTVLTGSVDNTAQLWDAATGKPIGLHLEHQGPSWALAFSPDGKALLACGDDNTARLWDAATGRPIGPPFAHQARVTAVAFSPDGKSVVTGSDDKTARIWAIPELPDDLRRLTVWVELTTGLGFDTLGVRPLDNSAWRERRDRLGQVGGPPEIAKRQQFDPILFGSKPTARARAWIERERWDDAEAAFNEVVLARPVDADVLLERAYYHVARSQPDKADNDFIQAYALGSRDSKLVETIVRNEALFQCVIAQVPHSATAMLWSQRGNDRARQQRWAEAAADFGQFVRFQPEDLMHRKYQILSLAAEGDLAELERVRSNLLDWIGSTGDPKTANAVAGYAALAPGLDASVERVIRLAELAVNGAVDAHWKESSLRVLGAALYRAGRFEDAIRRFDESIRFRSGLSGPKDWAFLAMAHYRLGHRDQASRFVQRLRSRPPSKDPNEFWNELQIRLPQNEAEATVLYDPIFPADPFRR